MVSKAVKEVHTRGQIYSRYGVRPIINGQGTTTTLGGSMIDPSAAEAMLAASGSMVLLKELNDRAGELIARYTGAEAGLVTSGAAGGMLLQAAAAMAGNDREKIRALPDTTGMKREVLILDHQKGIGYLQSWRTAGATLTPVNIDGIEIAEEAADRVVGQVGANTAAIGYVASRWLREDPPGFLEAVSSRSHARGIPVIVDAAAMLPPVENLRRYISEGADLVAFSGGKAIRGPQSAGILAGRKALIDAAAANGSPNSAVGRPLKVAKEEIIGLMVALERYVQRDHDGDQAHWRRQMETISARIQGIAGVRAQVLQDPHSRPVPEVAIFFEKDYRGPTGKQVETILETGEPPIVIGHANARGEDLYVNAHNVADGEEVIIAERLRAALLGKK